MAIYMFEAAFTSDAWATLAKNPQDRTEAVRTLLQGIGGKLISYYFAFGDYDVVVLAELPDNGAAAATAIAVAAGGAIRAVKTTPLLSAQEGVEAMRKAGEVNYRPPS
ncbi:MAG: GYD domain-containing protein [Chloroflexi bacterium]|nr:GYD domain-containing protein [Chloroflexota bacterium]